MRQEVMGFGMQWHQLDHKIKQSAPRSRQITTPTPHHSIFTEPTTQFFTGRMPFLPPNQQRQSTEGRNMLDKIFIKY